MNRSQVVRWLERRPSECPPNHRVTPLSVQGRSFIDEERKRGRIAALGLFLIAAGLGIGAWLVLK